MNLYKSRYVTRSPAVARIADRTGSQGDLKDHPRSVTYILCYRLYGTY